MAGGVVVVVGFQFSSLLLRPVFIHIHPPKKRFLNFFFLLSWKQVCVHTERPVEKSSLFLLLYIVYTHTHTSLFLLFHPSCLLLFWLLGSYKFLPPPSRRLWAQHRHSLLCLEDMCYRLIHRRRRFPLSAFPIYRRLCRGPTIQKSAPRTLTHTEEEEEELLRGWKKRIKLN